MREPHLCLCKQVGSCLLLSQSFPIKNKQNLKALKSKPQYNLFLENYPAFKGLTLHMEQQKCFLQMLMSYKYRRPWSDTAHYVRRLIRAYGICSAIGHLFTDDITNVDWKYASVCHQMSTFSPAYKNISENDRRKRVYTFFSVCLNLANYYLSISWFLTST